MDSYYQDQGCVYTSVQNDPDMLSITSDVAGNGVLLIGALAVYIFINRTI